MAQAKAFIARSSGEHLRSCIRQAQHVRESLESNKPFNLVVACVCAFVFCSVGRSAGQEARVSSATERLKLNCIRSVDGRFAVLGPDNVVNLELMNWAREVAEKLERLVGIKMPFQNRVLRIVTVREAPFDVGGVDSGRRIEGSEVVQRLAIRNYGCVDREEAEVALCRLLLDGYVFSARSLDVEGETPDEKRPDVTGDDGKQLGAPLWLAQGAFQNLYAGVRSRNNRIAVSRWQEGQLPSPVVLLRSAAKTSPSGEKPEQSAHDAAVSNGRAVCEDKVLHGMLVAWLVSRADKARCFGAIFRRLGAGRELTAEWFATEVLGGGSAGDIGEQWDVWILRRRRVIFQPGTVDLDTVNRLKAELLLYPGDFGIPLMGNPGEALGFRDLIDHCEAEWIPGFCRRKAASLRLLGIGRGKEFGKVVELYCRFLDLLGRRSGKRFLTRCIEKAEAGLGEFVETLRACRPEEAERDGDG